MTKNKLSPLFSLQSSVVFILLVLVDQLVKWWVITFHPSFVSANPGIAFGWIDNLVISYFLMVIGFIVLIWFFLAKKDLGLVAYNLSLTLISAGAISNLIDRLTRGYIVDYLNFLRLIFFNLADLFILLGVLIYAYQIFRNE